jgi:hypothetical protein
MVHLVKKTLMTTMTTYYAIFMIVVINIGLHNNQFPNYIDQGRDEKENHITN